MKNIYLANFSMTINPGEHKFLPYSVAGLWTYAEQDEQIKNNYQLAGLYYDKVDHDKILNELEDPFLFGFSVYIWNENYTKFSRMAAVMIVKRLVNPSPSTTITT